MAGRSLSCADYVRWSALPATHAFLGLAKKDVDARSAVAKTRLCPDMTNGEIE